MGLPPAPPAAEKSQHRFKVSIASAALVVINKLFNCPPTAGQLCRINFVCRAPHSGPAPGKPSSLTVSCLAY